ncbi:MAG: hypothetical protein ACPGUZ_02930 [Holosporaceae bacterium]
MRFYLYSIFTLFFLTAQTLWSPPPSDQSGESSAASAAAPSSSATSTTEDKLLKQFAQWSAADRQHFLNQLTPPNHLEELLKNVPSDKQRNLTSQQKTTLKNILNLAHQAGQEATCLVGKKTERWQEQDETDLQKEDNETALKRTANRLIMLGVKNAETKAQTIQQDHQTQCTEALETAKTFFTDLPRQVEDLLRLWIIEPQALQISKISVTTGALDTKEQNSLFFSTSRIPETESLPKERTEELEAALNLLQQAYQTKEASERAMQALYTDNLESIREARLIKPVITDLLKKLFAHLITEQDTGSPLSQLASEAAKKLEASNTISDLCVKNIQQIVDETSVQHEQKNAHKLELYANCPVPFEQRPAYMRSFASIYENLITLVQSTQKTEASSSRRLYKQLHYALNC